MISDRLCHSIPLDIRDIKGPTHALSVCYKLKTLGYKLRSSPGDVSCSMPTTGSLLLSWLWWQHNIPSYHVNSSECCVATSDVLYQGGLPLDFHSQRYFNIIKSVTVWQKIRGRDLNNIFID